MLIFTSLNQMAVFFDMIVMPRSRSRSIESMIRSVTCWFSRNVPLCRSIPSSSVVFPWSTWAMIAIFRKFVFLMLCVVRFKFRGFSPVYTVRKSST